MTAEAEEGNAPAFAGFRSSHFEAELVWNPLTHGVLGYNLA